jgi:hypothetical protein
MDTISLYEAGFLLAGVDQPPVPCQAVSRCVVLRKHGFNFPHNIEFEDDIRLTRIPQSLKVERKPFKSGLEMIAYFRSKNLLKIDRQPYGHFEWNYAPVSLSIKLSNIFSDLIKAVRSGSLPCVERGFLPETSYFEINRHSVHFLLDTKISRKAYDVWAAKLLGVVRVGKTNETAKIETEPVDANTERITDVAFVKSISSDALKLWEAISPGIIKDESYQAAIAHLKSHPYSKIKIEDIKSDFFKASAKPKRTILGAIVQTVLERNGYGLIGQAKIEHYLKNS